MNHPSLTTSDRPFFEPAPPTPNSISSVSPSMPPSAHRTSRRRPPRSATAPLPRGPPSPELSNLDCAFPPFPTTKSRSATPTRELEAQQSRSNFTEYARMHAEPSALFAPLSPRRNGGGRVLQRMNTIAPGPFDVASRDRRDGNQGPGMKQHKRTATAISSQDFPHPPTSDLAESTFQRPSTANSNRPRKPLLASISGGPRSILDREEQQISSDAQLSRPAASDANRQQLQQEPAPLLLRHQNRSQTLPISTQSRGGMDAQVDSQPQQPIESSSTSRSRRPTVSAISRPPLPINVTSQDFPFRSATAKIPAQSQDSGPAIHLHKPSQDEARIGDRPQATPPVQVPSRTNISSSGESYHTPTDSISSSGSSGSDARSGSSRSSPPLSDASARPRTKPTKIGPVGSSWINFQSSTDNLHSDNTKQPQSDVIPPRGVNDSLYLPVTERLPQRDANLEPPDSPMDPAMQKGRLSPFLPPSNQLPSAAPTNQAALTIPPARRRTANNKGNCRGCGELITGKSVSSADGRLTGRYHKRCFVCKTCKQPFQTADFYVLSNHPYCERHYHQLNHSLCRACDRGIEGQYLATESKQKFHPQCFTCQVRQLAHPINMQKAGTNRYTRIATWF